MAKDKFIIEPHFRLQEWVAEEKGYFAAKASTTSSGADQVDGRPAPQQGRQGRRHTVVRGGRGGRRELRLPLDGRGRRVRKGNGRL